MKTIILFLALAYSVHAQTAPKATIPIDDTGSLLVAPTATPDPKDGEAAEAPTPIPDNKTEPVPAKVEKENTPKMQKTADEGIQIQVEKVTGKSGAMNHTGEVKVYSPWPAKPISPAPLGWKFVHAPAGLAPYSATVKLGSGHSVDLSITPFVLVPVSDGLNAIRIAEPGYDASRTLALQGTVGIMLEGATAELEKNEQQAAAAISRLQQLLTSLPKQAP